MSRRLTDLAGPNIEAEEFLGAVLETAAQPLCVFDHDGVIRFVNPAALAALGYDRADELLGRQRHEAIHDRHPDGRPSGRGVPGVHAAKRRARRFAANWTGSSGASGSLFAVSYVSAPVAMTEGRGAVVAFADIEDTARAGCARHALEQQASFRRVAAIVADGTASAEVFAAIAGEAAQLLRITVSTSGASRATARQP